MLSGFVLLGLFASTYRTGLSITMNMRDHMLYRIAVTLLAHFNTWGYLFLDLYDVNPTASLCALFFLGLSVVAWLGPFHMHRRVYW